MIEIRGKYTSAKIFNDNAEEAALDQIRALCDLPFAAGAQVRVMPDVHAGTGCVIGFTADIRGSVIPNIVGVDIGCGMRTVLLGKGNFDFEKLDEAVRRFIPAGMNVREGRPERFSDLQKLHCYRDLKNSGRLERSLGTLGGGNHFIEADKDDDGNFYLVIHTGSRNLGKQVAELHQQLAVDLCSGKKELFDARRELIALYKEEGRRQEIQGALAALEADFAAHVPDFPPELCHLTGQYRDEYLEDMHICQQFARRNRELIAELLLRHWLGADAAEFEAFETVHNYIDHDSNIIRKGAVSAKKGETLLIPINMRDGSLLCVGKGNEDWNCSAPHGAGRKYSRMKARELFSVEDYAREMQGIYTTSVGTDTLDECPMAYKDMDEILSNLEPTATVQKIIRPVYNFKAGE